MSVYEEEEEEERDWSAEGREMGGRVSDEDGGNRRRMRDEPLMLVSPELHGYEIMVNVLWPVYRYRGTAWFTENYTITGIPQRCTQHIGWRLALSYSRERELPWIVQLKDNVGNTVYGCYQSHDAFVRNYVAPLESFENALERGVEQVIVEIGLTAHVRQAPDQTVQILDTSSHYLEVDYATRRLLHTKRLDNKRVRTVAGGFGSSLDEWEPPTICSLQNTVDGFEFCDERAFEVTPLDAPCKLTVTLDHVSAEDAGLLKHDMTLLLRKCFEVASDQINSGFEDVIFDEDLLRYRHNASTGELFFVYDDPALYFPNAAAQMRFWDFASKVMLLRYPHRDTELVQLRNERGVFTRKFGVNIEQFTSQRTQFLSNCVGIPDPDRPATHASPSPFSIGCVDTVMSDPVRVENLSFPIAVSHNFTIREVVEVAKRTAGLEHLDPTYFSHSPVRNRLLINTFAMPCLYQDHRHREDPATGERYHPGYRNEHQTWIQVDLDNRLKYSCTCRHPRNGHPRDVDDRCLVIDLGSLMNDLQPPAPITFTTPLLMPNQLNLNYGMDQVVHYQVEGIARYLVDVFHRRLIYSNGIWYVWRGELWEPNVGPDYPWLTKYLCHWVPRLLNDYMDDIPDGDKAQLKNVEALRKKFCSSLQSVHTLLKLMQDDMTNEWFEEARRHRGYVAAAHGIVDLRSGIYRDYRCEDYVTERSKLDFIPCDCEPGTCFDKGVHCKAQIIADMKWVDERIRECTGYDLKHFVWRAEDGEVGPVPRTAPQEYYTEYWLDKATGKEFFREPSIMEVTSRAVSHYTRHLELAYEDDGLRNYHRFCWTLGYMIAGFADLKLFVFGYGEQNNGKSLIWESLQDVFPEYFTPMHSSTVFSSGGSRKDDGPTPALMQVMDKRVGYVAEMSAADILNDASMKKWAGRDRQVGRFMRSEMTTFKPDLVAMVNSNVKPKMNILDEPSWDRFHLLHYPINYLRAEKRKDYPGPDWELHERPRDPSFVEEFKKPRIQQALYNWAIRKSFYYMRTKHCPLPALVQQKMAEMKNLNNPIPTFVESLDNNYVFDSSGEVSFRKFFSELKEWCKRENITNKFNTPAAFRKLVEQLSENKSDSMHIQLVGQKSTEEEAIRGIVDTTVGPISMMF